MLPILGDGAVLADHTVDFGTTQPINIDATGVLRIRFEATRAYDKHSGHPVLIDP